MTGAANATCCPLGLQCAVPHHLKMQQDWLAAGVGSQSVITAVTSPSGLTRSGRDELAAQQPATLSGDSMRHAISGKREAGRLSISGLASSTLQCRLHQTGCICSHSTSRCTAMLTAGNMLSKALNVSHLMSQESELAGGQNVKGLMNPLAWEIDLPSVKSINKCSN